MRVPICFTAFALLAACGPAPSKQAQGACALSADKPFAFSMAGGDDAATATASGPSCDQAAVTLTLRNAKGDLLWVYSADFHDITHGGPRAPNVAPSTDKDVQQFLDAWVDLKPGRTSALPAWAEGKSKPGEGAGPFAYATDLDRETYERLRAADLNDVCFASGAESARCLVMDPATNTPLAIVEYGP